MKNIILISLLLSGCATNQVVSPNIVKPDIEIMKECQEYIKPSIGTMADLLDVIQDNKKIYVLCSKLNNSKKEYIERQQKAIN